MKVTAPLRKSNSLVYIRIHDGRDIDFKVSAGIYIDPAHFDPKVPGYKRTSAVPAEVRSRTNKDIKAMIALAEENYRTGCDAEWLRQLLDDYRNSRPVATSTTPATSTCTTRSVPTSSRTSRFTTPLCARRRRTPFIPPARV